MYRKKIILIARMQLFTGISPNLMISVIDKIQLPLQINLIGKGNYTPKVMENILKLPDKLLQKKETQWPLEYLSKIFTISA